MTTRVIIPADGVTTAFGVPFPYLDRAHVRVEVDGVALDTSEYTWLSAGFISISPAPVASVNVVIYRATPSDALTIYQSGSVLTRDQLEVDSLQALYRVEELAEENLRSLRVPIGSTLDTLLPTPVPLGLLGFNEGLTALTTFDLESLGLELAAGVRYRVSVEAGAASVVLVVPSPYVVQALFYNGIYQNSDVWTQDGTTFTFAEPLPAAGTVEVLATAAALGTPADSGSITYQPPGTGAIVRAISPRLNDLLSIRGFGVVGNGIADDTVAADAAALEHEGLYVPAGSYNLAHDVYLFGEVADGVKLTGPGRFYPMRAVLEESKRFFIQSNTDATNTTVPNFLRRSVEVRAEDPDTEPFAVVVDATPNSTALGFALQALAGYARWSPSKVEELIPHIELGANYLEAMQYKDEATARYGGFRLAANDGNTTCFGSATAARGLLAAYRVTKQPSYLEACRRAVAYLKVLHDPNPTYQALYSETPIPDVPENESWASFCDRIQSDDKINITSSDWNLVAALFLQEMYDLDGDAALPAIIAAVQGFQPHGVLNGLDYFALKNAAPSSKVSVSWPFFSGHTYADGAWHRLGEPAGTNSIGSDQIEYGLASLHSLGYSVASLRSTYEVYRDLTHADVGVTTFGNAYDGAICFTGFFRINSTVYGGLGGNAEPIDANTSRAFGGYYDLQGAGALLKFKYDQYPEDFKASMPLAALAWDRGFGTDENFNTVWSAATGYSYYTKGVIPIAKACIGILETLETTR